MNHPIIVNLNSNAKIQYHFENIHDRTPSAVAHVQQVHSARVIQLTSSAQIISAEEADGILSDLSNYPIGVKTADCIPILGAALIPGSPRAIITALHAGRKGVLSRIASTCLDQAKTHWGTSAHDWSFWIGPAICGEHYELPNEIVELFFTTLPHLPQDSLRKACYPCGKTGFQGINLREVLRLDLLSLGVQESNISLSSDCTIEGPYHSYRRDKTKLRQWSWIEVVS